MRPAVFLFAILFALPSLGQTTTPGWIADSKTACRVWNPNPRPNETISWSGECKIGMAQGRGVLQWFLDGKPGSRYEGEYRGGKANGRGVYTYANGNRYDGEWKEGKRNGRGVFAFADGNRYEGEFKDDKANGIGTLFQGERTYSGTWTNGCYRQDDRLAVIGTTRKECGFE